MSSAGDSNSTVMWGPVIAFSCIVAMLAILLSLPFLLARARRVPALNRALHKLSCLMGAPWSPMDEQPQHHVRKPLSRAARNSLAVSTYQGPSGTAAPAAAAAAAAAADPTVHSEEADSCPICFCEYSHGQSLITLPCQHFFHQECIRRWLKRDATCPMCKHELQEGTEHHSSSSAASTAAGSSCAGSCTGTRQSASAAAAEAQPAAVALVAGVPAATGSSPAAAAAQTAAARPAGLLASSDKPAPLQEVVVAAH